ncbi:hypothetical protein HUJ04_000122 [Dendroctonus ponderosae]|nr:hypothetical protein HUJ04_000122 [Dendroctonus ponderosae]
MKLVHRDIDKGQGAVTLVPEEPEDMWHAYNLIAEGDSVKSSTIRKVQIESATGSSTSSRVRTTLTITVETIDFDTQACMLRLKGRNIEENQHVKVRMRVDEPLKLTLQLQMGAYHTLDLELNRKFSLRKVEWDSIALERIEQACDPTKSADVAAVIMQEGLAHVCLITSSMTLIRAKIDVTIPRKRKGLVQQHEKGLAKFYEQVMQAILRHVNFDVVKCVLVASPGFVRDQFFDYMLQAAVKTDNKLLLDNKTKFMLVHASSGFKHSLKEVLQDAAGRSTIWCVMDSSLSSNVAPESGGWVIGAPLGQCPAVLTDEQGAVPGDLAPEAAHHEHEGLARHLAVDEELEAPEEVLEALQPLGVLQAGVGVLVQGGAGAQHGQAEGADPLRHEGLLVHQRALALGLRPREARRVLQAQLVVQPEVGEAEQHVVELHEGGHDLEVHLGLLLGLEGEVVGHDPGDRFAPELRLVVVALDRDEDLAEGARLDDGVQELHGEAPAEGGLVAGHVRQRRERAEQEAQRQTVVQVAQRVRERRVALLHDVVELQRRVAVEVLAKPLEVLDGSRAPHLLVEDLVVAQRPDDRLVQQELHIFHVVERLDAAVPLLGALAVAGLARVDALEDAQAPEVVQRQLQLLERRLARHELRPLAGRVLWGKQRRISGPTSSRPRQDLPSFCVAPPLCFAVCSQHQQQHAIEVGLVVARMTDLLLFFFNPSHRAVTSSSKMATISDGKLKGRRVNKQINLFGNSLIVHGPPGRGPLVLSQNPAGAGPRRALYVQPLEIRNGAAPPPHSNGHDLAGVDFDANEEDVVAQKVAPPEGVVRHELGEAEAERVGLFARPLEVLPGGVRDEALDNVASFLRGAALVEQRERDGVRERPAQQRVVLAGQDFDVDR